ncbi:MULTISPECIES: DUF2169 family type VI secretion system accessory protein [Delftia]|uniref:DUF2169 domain-containing protein n=1 Tax=Delftia lacustris TaxID=558537 RepID=A0A1H3SDD5_9BURK|nr:DUF2169 domain-containing protein [Delftia lacustris]SDZ35605.1 hypothetical protein SAMN05421547_11968 [Delftia lacustris]
MLDNLTPFAAEILPGHGADGTLCSTVVIKATLDFEGRAVAQGNAVPVFRGDEFFGAEGPIGVVRHEADIAPLKSRVDVLFNGYAYAPGGKPAAHFDAGLAVGGESRVIRVFGKRVWRRRLGVLPLAQEVEPALKVPVTYNLAFGGADAEKPEVFHGANPIGAGFSAGLPREGEPMHQLEWPDDPVRSAVDRVSPAGFGCIGRSWLPRRALWGSYTGKEVDASPGLLTRMPASFDPAAWNCAHPRMQFRREQVQPGTKIAWMNLSAQGMGTTVVPAIRPQLSWVLRGERGTARPEFDTLIIEPEHGHLILIWRHTLAAHVLSGLESVQIHL